MSSQPLVAATELAARSTYRMPNEPADYRAAREALLAEEIELRRHLARVAAQRGALPPGGAVPAAITSRTSRAPIRLADMFGDRDTLVTYFWMYGPQRERPCPMCTFLGPLDANAGDIEQQVALAVIGRSPVARQELFARERGWRSLRFYATIGDLPDDYRGLGPDGADGGALNIFGSGTAGSPTSGAASLAARPRIPARIRAAPRISRRSGTSSI